MKKYVLLGLRASNKSNYFEGLPEAENEEEQWAFSKALELIGDLIAKEPGAVRNILEVIEP